MTNDGLTEKLRYFANPICHEAADLIEELETDKHTLTRTYNQLFDEYKKLEEKVRVQLDEILSLDADKKQLESRELGYIQSLRELEARVRELDWISVEDRLPSDDLKQVCAWEADCERASVCEFPKGWAGMLKHKYITHWKPLPSPPKAE